MEHVQIDILKSVYSNFNGRILNGGTNPDKDIYPEQDVEEMEDVAEVWVRCGIARYVKDRPPPEDEPEETSAAVEDGPPPPRAKAKSRAKPKKK